MKKLFIAILVAFMAINAQASGKALVIMLDASGENYACNDLLNHNIKTIKRYFNRDYIRQNQIKKVISVVFSRQAEIVASVDYEMLPRMRDSIKMRRFIGFAQNVLEDAIKAMPDYHTYKDGNQEKLYGKDIAGALLFTINELQSRGINEATIILASDMIQSVNRSKTGQYLKKHPITLPNGYRLIILGKAFMCSPDVSELERNSAMRKWRQKWMRYIKPSEQVQYRLGY